MQEHETRRLRLIPFSLELRKAALADKDRLAELLGVRVPASWPGPDLAEALPFFISEVEKHPTLPIWDGLIIHKEDATLIGDMGFKGGPDAHGRLEIGYSIIPEYRNQGYATEMACHLIGWAWQQPGVTSVVAECLDNNLGSIRVLEKVGMRRLGAEGSMLRWEVRRTP
ncbi:MAG TPA: GNAT family N-acetyltransferase [Ktedonobacteraceae bacterium]|jgi:ribosomal-protein-alanine N-acetyltransferase|nr:GNAT family N-acetyltransferase [Ktedonobacteraceae bacterium]